ncbi:MAG: hypothetical protein R3E08_02730 [Thiotrichaceae bacterium]
MPASETVGFAQVQRLPPQQLTMRREISLIGGFSLLTDVIGISSLNIGSPVIIAS